MKKILAQKTFFSESTSTTTTLQNYTKIYEVPPPTTPDSYSNTIFSDCDIRVYPNEKSWEKIEMNYNIRIVSWTDLNDPRTKIFDNWGNIIQNIWVDESKDMRNKWVIVNTPDSDKEVYPMVYRWIKMQTWDRIVVQCLTPWITVQVFGEELQYDTDAHFKMHRDRMIAMQTMLDTRLTEINETLDDKLSEINETLDDRMEEANTELSWIHNWVDNIQWCCT